MPDYPQGATPEAGVRSVRNAGRLLRLLRPFWRDLARLAALSIAVSGIGMLPPYLTKLLVDRVYPTGDVTLLTVVVGGLFVLQAGAVLVGALQNYVSVEVGGRLDSSVTLFFLNHVQHLPLEFFERRPVGEVTARIADAAAAAGTVASVLHTAVTTIFTLLLLPVLLVVLDARLAAIAIAGALLGSALNMLSLRFIRRQWRATANATAAASAQHTEVLTQIHMHKMLALEPFVFAQTRGLLAGAYAAKMRASGLSSLIGVGVGTIGQVQAAVTLWVGWHLVLNHQLTLGGFLAFQAYSGYLVSPITEAMGLVSRLQQSSVYIDRMYEYLDHEPEQDPTTACEPHPPVANPASGRLECVALSYGYGSDPDLFSDVSFVAVPGSVTALVGASGSGKSTLLRMLAGGAAPRSGIVTLDGCPLSDLPLADVRRQVTAVWQDVGILRGTLWHNLTLGRDCALAEVDEVIQLCQLAGDIAALPMGYDTPVGERGVTLSGGQRQRVAIARALLRDAPVLLLDEATANLDVDTENRLMTLLLRRYPDKTIVFASHRPETVALATRVYRLRDRRLTLETDDGGHDGAHIPGLRVARRVGHNSGDPAQRPGRERCP